MSTISVCPDCRTTCAKCHNSTKASHPVWVCKVCKHEYENKCCVCGGKKNRPGSRGSIGAGKVCDRCYKINTCTFCGTKI